MGRGRGRGLVFVLGFIRGVLLLWVLGVNMGVAVYAFCFLEYDGLIGQKSERRWLGRVAHKEVRTPKLRQTDPIIT